MEIKIGKTYVLKGGYEEDHPSTVRPLFANARWVLVEYINQKDHLDQPLGGLRHRDNFEEDYDLMPPARWKVGQKYRWPGSSDPITWYVVGFAHNANGMEHAILWDVKRGTTTVTTPFKLPEYQEVDF